MERSLVATPLVLVGILLAGCAAPAPHDDGGQDNALDPATARLLGFLGNLTKPAYDRAAGVDWWESFTNTYSLRQWPLPTNLAASQYLEKELAAAGFQAKTLYVGPGPDGQPSLGSGPVGFRVVQGLKEGTAAKDQRIVLISHYDTVPTTLQGAYDDAAGVAVEMQICKLLGKVATNHTIECLFFDNEEDGLVASGAYTDWYVAAKPPWKWVQAFGYDMTGLNWPGYTKWSLDAHIGVQRGKDALMKANADFLSAVGHRFLNHTEDGYKVLLKYTRNSDEVSFRNIGVPVVRFAGGEKAGDYPQYHKPDDTVEFVYKFACDMCADRAKGKAIFAQGVEGVVLTSFYTILAYDQYDPAQLPPVVA